MLVAGKGQVEDVINGAAARPVVAAREGRAKESPREGRNRGEEVSREGSMSRARERAWHLKLEHPEPRSIELEMFLIFFFNSTRTAALIDGRCEHD